mmetsp:Transcript_22852/g.58478  ORF Transcript_22852/g.58478 Transcript_22852/m.58478 type:complete len:223 (+) Transcript_22852:821-1489(+)
MGTQCLAPPAVGVGSATLGAVITGLRDVVAPRRLETTAVLKIVAGGSILTGLWISLVDVMVKETGGMDCDPAISDVVGTVGVGALADRAEVCVALEIVGRDPRAWLTISCPGTNAVVSRGILRHRPQCSAVRLNLGGGAASQRLAILVRMEVMHSSPALCPVSSPPPGHLCMSRFLGQYRHRHCQLSQSVRQRVYPRVDRTHPPPLVNCLSPPPMIQLTVIL